MRLNGSAAPVAGVTIVGTLPAYRRRSYLRKVTAAHFQGLYERGDYAVAALFASRVAIYQRYGYAVVSTKGMYSVEPRNLNLIAGPEVPGEFREAGDEDTETILDLYHRFIEDKTGYLHRNKSFEVAEGSPLTVVRNFVPTNILVKVLYIEAGQPAGYIIYFIERDSRPGNVGGQRLNVTDLIWHSPMAYRAIWHYFRNMDLVQDVIWGRVPPDDPLPHIMLEPRELKLTSADGLLGRIVNVAGALPLRPYSDEGTLTFEIVDGFCEWNQGKWEMTATVDGTEVKHSDKSPQLTMPVSTLAMLMFGQISASAAARMGRLDVADGDALEMWDRVMRTKYPPFCADSF
jgi:predicted acetyltransferase